MLVEDNKGFYCRVTCIKKTQNNVTYYYVTKMLLVWLEKQFIHVYLAGWVLNTYIHEIKKGSACGFLKVINRLEKGKDAIKKNIYC
jgi:hypothetical protein